MVSIEPRIRVGRSTTKPPPRGRFEALERDPDRGQDHRLEPGPGPVWTLAGRVRTRSSAHNEREGGKRHGCNVAASSLIQAPNLGQERFHAHRSAYHLRSRHGGGGIVVVLTSALVYAACILGTRTDRDYQAKRDSHLSGIR